MVREISNKAWQTEVRNEEIHPGYQTSHLSQVHHRREGAHRAGISTQMGQLATGMNIQGNFRMDGKAGRMPAQALTSPIWMVTQGWTWW